MKSYYANPVTSAPVEVVAVPIDQPGYTAGVNNSYRNFPRINEAGARAYLSEYRWPVGLQECLLRSLVKIPIRFMICDDSGSMVENDGHRLVGSAADAKMISCSRWSELGEAMKFHMGLARAASATTEIRLLNGCGPVTLGSGAQDADSTAISTLSSLFAESPGGGTPLCRHIGEVVSALRALEPQLRAANQRAGLLIATDGESSDGNIAEAMRPLEQLPVWVVGDDCDEAILILS
jgi:hypothetical protein